MTDTRFLAIGGYNAVDAERLLADLDAPPILRTLADALALPEADRATITAIAYQGHAPFGGDEMQAFPKLGLIANYGVGYDAIDVAAAAARGIKVTNTPGVLNDDVADLAVAMLLAHGRNMVAGDAWVRTGAWRENGAMPLNRKISGGRAGILGLGRIGREIADRLAAFKMEIHYHSRSPKDTPEGWQFHADAVELAKAVDYLVIALVGGPDTVGYTSRAVLEALGPEGILVNISRGSTVDEAAMLDLLENGGLGGAALDVFNNEPDIDPRFQALENVHLQPHQGSGTHQTRAAMGQLQRDNVAAFLSGADLLTPVN